MSQHITPPGDEFNIRCPRLGHQLIFSYCRSENNGLPCFKILDCWFEHFNIQEYLKAELEPEEWDNLVNRPGPRKVQSLLELIEQVKKTKTEDS